MGMFDTMNQGVKPTPQMGNSIQSAVGGMGGGNGGSFAQKQMMQKNPVMQGRPAMSQSFGQPSMSQTPNAMGQRPMMGQQPGMQGGAKSMLQAKMAAGQSPIQGSGLGPSPAMQQESMAQPPPQSGLSPLQTPLEQQIMQQKMAASPDLQMGAAQSVPEPEQDMGSQDPRELLRMKMMGGLGPSNPMEQMGYAGAQQMNPAAPPVQMDENGLEPRRGAR